MLNIRYSKRQKSTACVSPITVDQVTIIIHPKAQEMYPFPIKEHFKMYPIIYKLESRSQQQIQGAMIPSGIEYKRLPLHRS